MWTLSTVVHVKTGHLSFLWAFLESSSQIKESHTLSAPQDLPHVRYPLPFHYLEEDT